MEVFQHSSNIGTARLGEADRRRAAARTISTRFGLTAAGQGRADRERPAADAARSGTRTPSPRPRSATASTSARWRWRGPIRGLLNGGELLPLTIRSCRPGREVHGPRMVSEKTAAHHAADHALQRHRRGSGKSANVPGLNVGGKTGTGDKWDPAITRYSHDQAGLVLRRRLPDRRAAERAALLRADPAWTSRSADKTGVDPTGGIVAAPAAGQVIERIAPFLGVKRARRDQPVRASRRRPPTTRRGALSACASPTWCKRDLAVDPEIEGVTADSRKVQPGLPVRRPAGRQGRRPRASRRRPWSRAPPPCWPGARSTGLPRRW